MMTTYRWAFFAMLLPIVAMLAYGLAVRSRAILLIGGALLVVAALLALALYLSAQAGPPPTATWGGSL